MTNNDILAEVPLTIISDTHGKHRSHSFPRETQDGSVLLHCGDSCNAGTEEEFEDFIEWFQDTPFENKIFIAGNHDIYLEGKTAEDLNLPDDVHYLNESSVIINDVKYYGNPYTSWDAPPPHRWAFTRWDKDHEFFKRTALNIPEDTDVLLCHGPMRGYMDQLYCGQHVGCPYLRERVEELSFLRLRVFAHGHIHEERGHVVRPVLNLNIFNAALTKFNFNLDLT